jgi:succinate-acetate transporter protein
MGFATFMTVFCVIASIYSSRTNNTLAALLLIAAGTFWTSHQVGDLFSSVIRQIDQLNNVVDKYKKEKENSQNEN